MLTPRSQAIWSIVATLCVGLTANLLNGAEAPVVSIIGHRGSSFLAPENTQAAIDLAWEEQADGVEFDVWLSRDGEVVLHHDQDLKRTAGVPQRINELSLAELKKLEVGRWKDAKYTGEPIPLLRDVLTKVPAKKKVYIEVKCGPEVVGPLRAVFEASTLAPEQTQIISFSGEVCRACKTAFPERKVQWIVALKQDPTTGEWNHSAEELIASAKDMGVDGLDLQAVPLLDDTFGSKVRSAGLDLLVWTVNDPTLARKMVAAGVQGITTDRPGWLRAQLAR